MSLDNNDDIILRTEHIHKEFYGNVALDDINIEIKRGEIHALCGENGAGKSTLMKVLCGVYIPEAGSIYIKGEKIHLKVPRDMTKYGISIIFQEFNLMPDLTVAENIYLPSSETIGKSILINRKRQNIKIQALLDKLEINIKPNTLVRDLSVSEKQMIEIAKALFSEAEIIIMDEPTASLNSTEVSQLYKILSKLKSDNKTIIYVSHRMQEIFDLSDRVTVLRDGKYIDTCNTRDLNHEKIANMMVGREIKLHNYQKRNIADEYILKVDDLCKHGVYENISFKLRKGEILGISGLMGCGREELAKTLYGLNDYDNGSIKLYGKDVKIKNPSDAMKQGLMFLTDDRKDSGIFGKMGVGDNIVMNEIDKLKSPKSPFISKTKYNDLISKYMGFLKIKCTGPKQEVVSLSGGNQQKVVLARALTGECKIVLLLEPTRGVDIATKAEIYSTLTELANRGVSFIFISSDLPELLSMSDRLLVMWQGRITGEFIHDENMTEEAVMLCAIGKDREKSGGKS